LYRRATNRLSVSNGLAEPFASGHVRANKVGRHG
jgi:hypothetical protein